LWLDASDVSTLWADTAGATAATNNGRVARWDDKSGAARHATQTASDARPIRRDARQNGLTALAYDGTDDYMALSALSLFRDIGHAAISVVSKVADKSQFIFGAETGTAGSTRIGLSTSTAPNDRRTILARRVDGTTASSVSSTNVTAGAFTIQIGVFGYADGVIAHHENGVAVGTASISSGKTTDTDSAAISVGKLGTSFFANGDVSELVVTLTAMSTATRRKLEGYLSHKWGLTGSLPADHPYKSRAPTVKD